MLGIDVPNGGSGDEPRTLDHSPRPPSVGEPPAEPAGAEVLIERAPEQEPRADEPPVKAPRSVDEDRRPGDQPQEPAGAWIGITRPSRQGASPRFLTDVIVEMGLATRLQVDDAVES